MLSNPPPSGLQARIRQHRRQNSTPSAIEAMKIATNLPNNMHPQQHQQQQHHHQFNSRARMSQHRRGMSLDTRRQQMHSPATTRQDFHMVSEHTNTTGFSSTPQHVLREAQQQRIARPGTHQQQAFANLATDENYLMSPHGTPLPQQGYDGLCYDGLQEAAQQSPMDVPFDMHHPNAVNFMMKAKRESLPENIVTSSQDFELFPTSTMSTPTFMSFNESPTGAPGWTSEGETSSTRRSSRRISNGIMDRVVKFETLGVDAPQRPLTPPHQNANGT
jgi:regulatory protein SWI5